MAARPDKVPPDAGHGWHLARRRLRAWRPAGAILVFLLGLAPSPLNRPGMEEPLPSSSPAALVPRPEIACAQEALPPNATVLLFSSPDGSLKLDPGLHYLLQAELAPRLLTTRSGGERAFAGSQWFLGLAGGTEGARWLASRHHLVPVRQCGPWSILRSAP